MLDKTKKKLGKCCFIELNHNFQNSIFLAAVGRSGTTWVSDIINYNNDYRTILEPFHPNKVDSVKHFQYIQYLRTENREPRFLEPASDVLSGRIRNRWVDSSNKKIFARKRLIKDIRANLLLKWIRVNFPEIPIILLFRHPCAVANSWLKLKWGVEDLGERTDLEICLSQEELMKDFLQPFRKDIERAQSEFEKHIFFWCMQYYVPLKQFKQEEIHLSFYEEFCENPRTEIDRLFRFIDMKIDEKVLQNLNKPSSVSRKDSAVVKGTNLIDTWRRDVSAENLNKALDILKLFGLDAIYSNDSMPNVSAAYEMLRCNE